MRNKEETKRRLLDSVGRIILKEGVQSVRVNSVAAETGVDKVLIYRYFGGIDGLLSEYISKIDFFGNAAEKFGDLESIRTKKDFIEAIKQMFFEQLREMSGNKILREILIWELSTNSPIAREIAQKREASSNEIINSIKNKFNFGSLDVEGAVSIISASVSYLAIRSKTVDVYSGISLTSEKGWKRLENTIESLLDTLAKNISISETPDE